MPQEDPTLWINEDQELKEGLGIPTTCYTKESDPVEVEVSGEELRALLPEIDGVGYEHLARIPGGVSQYYEDTGLSKLLSEIETHPEAEFPLTLQKLTKHELPDIKGLSAKEALSRDQLLRFLQSSRLDNQYVQVEIRGNPSTYSLTVPESQITKELLQGKTEQWKDWMTQLTSIDPAYANYDGGDLEDDPSLLSSLYNRFGKKIILGGVLAATLLPLAAGVVGCMPKTEPTPTEPSSRPTDTPEPTFTSTPEPSPTPTPTDKPVPTVTPTPPLRECVSSDLEGAFTPYNLPSELIEDETVDPDILESYLQELGYLLKDGTPIYDTSLELEKFIEGERRDVCRYPGIILTNRGELETLPVVADKAGADKLWIPHAGGEILAPIEVEIEGLNWEPSKVVNDKVYDGKVNFVAKSNGPNISEAKLIFSPRYYPHLQTQAFPQEDPRELSLKPLDGEFDEPEEEFAAVIENILGGREYQIKANVTNETGQKVSAQVETPYIREFENIADDDDILIIADYYPWYELPTEPGNHWYRERNRQHLYMPLLGEYSSGDPVVISKHIDWATGHGIDAFSISWWTTGKDERLWDRHSLNNTKEFLNNDLINDIKFCILYEDVGRLNTTKEGKRKFIYVDDDRNRERLINDFRFLAENYFNNPQYLKIGNKPVVQFDADRIWKGDIKDVISNLRTETKKEGDTLYLISNILGWYYPNAPYDEFEPRNRQIVESMDAISAHGNMWLYGRKEAREDFPSFVEGLYERWYEYAIKINPNIDLIPNLMPGEELHPYIIRDPAYIPLKRSPGLMDKLIKVASDYTGKHRKIWKISAFNEWLCGLQIEPSKEEGFTYLKTLKKI